MKANIGCTLWREDRRRRRRFRGKQGVPQKHSDSRPCSTWLFSWFSRPQKTGPPVVVVPSEESLLRLLISHATSSPSARLSVRLGAIGKRQGTFVGQRSPTANDKAEANRENVVRADICTIRGCLMQSRDVFRLVALCVCRRKPNDMVATKQM